jgi:hypothetical protein
LWSREDVARSCQKRNVERALDLLRIDSIQATRPARPRKALWVLPDDIVLAQVVWVHLGHREGQLDRAIAPLHPVQERAEYVKCVVRVRGLLLGVRLRLVPRDPEHDRFARRRPQEGVEVHDAQRTGIYVDHMDHIAVAPQRNAVARGETLLARASHDDHHVVPVPDGWNAMFFFRPHVKGFQAHASAHGLLKRQHARERRPPLRPSRQDDALEAAHGAAQLGRKQTLLHVLVERIPLRRRDATQCQ